MLSTAEWSTTEHVACLPSCLSQRSCWQKDTCHEHVLSPTIPLSKHCSFCHSALTLKPFTASSSHFATSLHQLKTPLCCATTARIHTPPSWECLVLLSSSKAPMHPKVAPPPRATHSLCKSLFWPMPLPNVSFSAFENPVEKGSNMKSVCVVKSEPRLRQGRHMHNNIPVKMTSNCIFAVVVALTFAAFAAIKMLL